MTLRKRPGATVNVGKWSATVTGPVRYTVPAVRAALGRLWSVEYDNRRRCIRCPASRAADVVAALEADGVRVTIKGALPAPELWESG